MKKKSLRPYLWMLAGSVAFSLMGTMTQLAGRGCSWQVTAVVRALVPLLLVALWARMAGARLVAWGPPVLWMRSLAGSCSLVMAFYVMSRLPLTEVYTISNMFPLWVALLSWPLLGKLPSPAIWLSVFSGVAGVVVINLDGDLPAGDPALLIAVAGSLFTALAMMGLHQLKHLDPRAVVVHFSGTALAFALVAALAFDAPEAAEPFAWTHALMLVGVGVTAAAGQYCLTRAYTHGEPARVSVVGLSQILMALVLDLTVLGHELKPQQLLGIPLILIPTAWLMLLPARRSKPAPHLEPAPTES